VDLRADLLLEAADALLEELVDVRADDREELDALEQRQPVILRLVQHPPAEVEVGQLAVEAQLGRGDIGRDDLAEVRRGRGSPRHLDGAERRSRRRLLGNELEPVRPRYFLRHEWAL
jgi:hypothetical protein